MDELAKNLSSPAWWIGVVIVGLLINLASAYAKPAIDHFMSRLSRHWQTRTLERRNAYEKEVSELVANSDQQRQYEHQHISQLLHALFGLGFVAILIAMKITTMTFPELSIAKDLGVPPEKSAAVFYALISVIMLASMKLFISADAIEDKLDDVRRRAKGLN